jgi:hypothetical protein
MGVPFFIAHAKHSAWLMVVRLVVQEIGSRKKEVENGGVLLFPTSYFLLLSSYLL